jgi:effector-binding domain-containing protein
MASAYEELTKFIQDNGQEASGVTYEMYLNDPTETSPQELQTQIFFPLKST